MRKGFTLVELLIVLAVIAALMSVATPLALNAVKNAKASQVAQNFRNIKVAFENYFNTEKPEDPKSINIATLYSEGYLSSSPTNFTITVAATTAGVYTVKITYSGGDVDVDKVKNNGLPEVTSSATDLILTFNVYKWW
ncbi:type II secretion system protein [Fervidobacterium pennivorans subsp. carthaginiensis]|uniref:type II secretion system protein n=1 Tax=Fervidobacterium pennivorans TaxID=93466 RepID=UPI00355B6F14